MKQIIFKKIKFLNIKDSDFNQIIKKNGLFLFPSGPGLSTILYEKKYHNSLKKADFVFLDSGFFVLLLNTKTPLFIICSFGTGIIEGTMAISFCLKQAVISNAKTMYVANCIILLKIVISW